MVAANKAKQASKIAASVKAATTDSTLAGLAGRATTESATAGRAAGLATGAKITGQYLYDSMIGNFAEAEAKGEVTKMEVVRLLVPMTAPEVKAVIADFVGVAKSYFEKAVDTAKQAGGFDDKNPPVAVRAAKSRLKTAQNYQTRMRNAYGALKFAPQQLAKLGGSDQTGFVLMDELGRKALADAGLNWDGTKAESKETKNQRAEQREEAEILQQVMAENPRKENENRADYFARIDSKIDAKKKAIKQEQQAAVVEMLAKKFREMAGDNLAEVLEAIAQGKGTTPEAQPDVNLH